MRLLRHRAEQLAAQQELTENYPREVIERAQTSLDALSSLWEDPSSVVSSVNEDAYSPTACLEAFKNLAVNKTDYLGLPLIVDVIDSFGKPGSGT